MHIIMRLPRCLSFLSIVVLLAALLPPISAGGDEGTNTISPHLADVVPVSLPEELLPYNGSFARPLPVGDNYDEEGVARRLYDGKYYDHPVSQAQAALSLLSSYRHNQDDLYLKRARANADRLIETAVVRDGALFFPYPFDFALHGGRDLLKAPWYSGMAQGQALSAFVRLYNVTGDARYRMAADETFRSFQLPREDSSPWVQNIDHRGFAWFEEYADEYHPDFTFNGHGFAVYGLYEYYFMSQSIEVLEYFQMGVATMRRYIEDIRNPGWISRYCLTHETLSVGYHNVHTEMMFKIYSMTGDSYFATIGDLLIDDHPNPNDYGTGHFSSGTFEVRKFDSRGIATESSSITIVDSQRAKVSSRAKIKGQAGIWLKVEDGPMGGYWVPESSGTAHILGLALQRVSFSPERRIDFERGTYTGYEYARNGSVLGSKRAGLVRDSAAYADMRALVNGVVHYRITRGLWAGMWVPMQDGVTVSRTQVDGTSGEFHRFSLPLATVVHFSQGTHVGSTFSEDGIIVSSKRAGLNRDSAAFADSRAFINGRTYFHIKGGIWDSLWVPTSSDVYIRS
ncbi:MAG: D-glucuronyl C5-epimerase family protein [Arachnia sp.]